MHRGRGLGVIRGAGTLKEGACRLATCNAVSAPCEVGESSAQQLRSERVASAPCAHRENWNRCGGGLQPLNPGMERLAWAKNWQMLLQFRNKRLSGSRGPAERRPAPLSLSCPSGTSGPGPDLGVSRLLPGVQGGDQAGASPEDNRALQ